MAVRPKQRKHRTLAQSNYRSHFMRCNVSPIGIASVERFGAHLTMILKTVVSAHVVREMSFFIESFLAQLTIETEVSRMMLHVSLQMAWLSVPFWAFWAAKRAAGIRDFFATPFYSLQTQISLKCLEPKTAFYQTKGSVTFVSTWWKYKQKAFPEHSTSTPNNRQHERGKKSLLTAGKTRCLFFFRRKDLSLCRVFYFMAMLSRGNYGHGNFGKWAWTSRRFDRLICRVRQEVMAVLFIRRESFSAMFTVIAQALVSSDVVSVATFLCKPFFTDIAVVVEIPGVNPHVAV